jgi:hypothetical protein
VTTQSIYLTSFFRAQYLSDARGNRFVQPGLAALLVIVAADELCAGDVANSLTKAFEHHADRGSSGR